MRRDLHVQFTKAADAANRAVMADTDEASVTFAREAEQATQARPEGHRRAGADAEGPRLLGRSRLLQEFVSRFAEYRELDRRILDLAVQNTNLKAQRLSFGPAQEAADAFRDAAQGRGASGSREGSLASRGARRDGRGDGARDSGAAGAAHCRRRRRRDDADGAGDGDLGGSRARAALKALAPLIAPASRPRLAAATAALDRFMALNAEIIALSRRNTNVRSLALSLDQKRDLTAACEERLQALQAALAKRGYPAGR